MSTDTQPIEVRLAALLPPRKLARACGRSRYWIIKQHNSGSLPFTLIAGTRMSSLADLWSMIQADTERERERLAILPKPTTTDERAARVTGHGRRLSPERNQR